MSVKTIDLPISWFRTADSKSASSLYMRFGWSYDSYNGIWYRIHGWTQFNFSAIAGMLDSQILGGEIKTTQQWTAPGSNPIYLWRVLRTVENASITWTKYSSVGSWAVAGGLSPGSDIYAVQLATHVFADLENSVSLSAANIRTIRAANSPILFSMMTQPAAESWIQISSAANIFLRVSYETSSLAGDVVMF